MEKIKINKIIEYYINEHLEDKIENVIIYLQSKINEYSELGWSNIKIEKDYTDNEYHIYGVNLETDFEFEIRKKKLEQEEKQKLSKIEFEKQEYLRLKQIYGNN